VFEGACAFEVGVEHAVGEDHVGLAAGDGLVKGVAEVLPQAVENDAVEAVAVGKEPRMRSGGGPNLLWTGPRAWTARPCSRRQGALGESRVRISPWLSI